MSFLGLHSEKGVWKFGNSFLIFIQGMNYRLAQKKTLVILPNTTPYIEKISCTKKAQAMGLNTVETLETSGFGI